MSLKALIFDVDGTLANTERDGHLKAFNLAFKEFNLDWVWSNEMYYHLLDVTGGKLRIKYYLKKYNPEFSHDDLENLVNSIHALKTKKYVHLINNGIVPLRTGVKRLFLEAKKAGLRLAIATTTTPDNVNALIKNTLGDEAIGFFEVIAAGDCVKNLKPAGDVYQFVLDKMQLKNNEVIAFEDSKNGIVSANSVGINSVITINQYTQHHIFNGAMVVLDNLGEPNKDFKIIKGDKTKHTFLSVDYLQELYARYC